MLKISPIQSKEVQSELCSFYKIEYKPSALAYSAFDSELEKIIGICQFSISGGRGEILDLVCGDNEALMLMGRTAVSFMDHIGISECVMRCSIVDRMSALRIGFRPDKADGSIWKIDTSWSPCEEHKK